MFGDQGMNGRNICKTLLAFPVAFLAHFTLLLSAFSSDLFTRPDVSFSQNLAEKIFGRITLGEIKSVVLGLDHLFFFMLFSLLFGSYIYQNFTTSSVYLFSRIKKRRKWLFSISLRLILYSFMYNFFYLLTTCLIMYLVTPIPVTFENSRSFVLLLTILTFLMANFTIIINLLSIRFGSGVGFVLSYAVFVFLVSIIINNQDIPDFPGKNIILFYLNPASIMALSLNDFPITQAFLLLCQFLWLAVTIGVGGRWIDRLDIALADRESQY